jgi:hypothetical protein
MSRTDTKRLPVMLTFCCSANHGMAGGMQTMTILSRASIRNSMKGKSLRSPFVDRSTPVSVSRDGGPTTSHPSHRAYRSGAVVEIESATFSGADSCTSPPSRTSSLPLPLNRAEGASLAASLRWTLVSGCRRHVEWDKFFPWYKSQHLPCTSESRGESMRTQPCCKQLHSLKDCLTGYERLTRTTYGVIEDCKACNASSRSRWLVSVRQPYGIIPLVAPVQTDQATVPCINNDCPAEWSLGTTCYYWHRYNIPEGGQTVWEDIHTVETGPGCLPPHRCITLAYNPVPHASPHVGLRTYFKR